MNVSHRKLVHSHSRFVHRALRLSIMAASAALLSPVTWAQSSNEQAVEEINVTGSRILQPSGMNSPVPVTALTPIELRSFEPGGTMSQQLDALPQFFNNGTPQRGDGGNAVVGSGGPGALNIRNLNVATTGSGISRTLTLLDGARVVPTDKRGTVNIDMFPTALMRTVEIVTGGASAAYGADALGGVVNFVLDRQFEGLKVSLGTGVNEYKSTGKQLEVSIAGGTKFLDDRLHMIGSFESRSTDEILSDRYRWKRTAEQWGYVTNPDWIKAGCTAGVACAAGPQRLTMMNVVTANDSPTGLFRGTGTSLDWMQFTVDGTGIVPYDFGNVSALPGIPGSTATISGGPEAQTAFLTSQGGPSGMEAINRSVFLGFQYELFPGFLPFVQGMAGVTQSNDTSNTANFTFNGTSAPLIAIDNVFLPQVVRDVMTARNLTQIAVNKRSAQFDGRPELGSDREAHNTFTQQQWSVGFDWAFIDNWNLRASFQRGKAKRNSLAVNLQQVDRAFLGMDAVRDPNGKIVCRVQLFNPTLEQLSASVAGRISNLPLDPYIPAGLPGNTQPLKYPVEPQAITDCVPYNVLGSGNMSREAIEYVGTDKLNLGYVNQDFAEAIATGQLHEGWGAGPIGFAGGVTWREQDFISGAAPHDLIELGPPVNVPSLGIRGIPSGFALSTPGNLHLFSTVPYIAGRMHVWEWFTEVNVPVWKTNSDQALDVDFAARRSTYDRSGAIDSWKVGANLDVYKDLRFRVTRSRDVREPSFSELFDAQASGSNVIDRAFNNESYLVTAVRGGNRDLRPEVATTNTAGFVYKPSFAEWIEGVQLSSDWYDVRIHDAVAQLGGQRIADECAAGTTSLCDLITRGNDGRIVYIYDGFLNVAAARARGVDTEVIWRVQPDFLPDLRETFNLRWLTGYMTERSDTPLGGTAQNTAGVVGMPKLTSNITATYSIENWSVQLQARYVDSVKRNRTWTEGIDVDDNSVASMSWFNGRIGYNGKLQSGASWTAALNVSNLLNREPPLFGGTNGTYDQFGRRYNLSLNLSW